MNSGTASSAKFCVSEMVSWIGMVEGSSGCCRKNTQPEMPMANATGIPISSSTANATSTQSTRAGPRRRAARWPFSSSASFRTVVMRSSSPPTTALAVTHE